VATVTVKSPSLTSAEHAHAADRYARAILAISAPSRAARSRRWRRNSADRNMSDDYLKIIPASPDHVPPKRTHLYALTLLEAFFPEGEDFQVGIYDGIEFIDQGENIEAVICPACMKRLEMNHFTEGDPIVAWWYDLSETMENTAVTSITTKMPCCGRVVRLTELEFDWPAGFARFELNVMNPNVAENLTQSQLHELEQILGCQLRQVRAHY
jgi:hypothetical protein